MGILRIAEVRLHVVFYLKSDIIYVMTKLVETRARTVSEGVRKAFGGQSETSRALQQEALPGKVSKVDLVARASQEATAKLRTTLNGRTQETTVVTFSDQIMQRGKNKDAIIASNGPTFSGGKVDDGGGDTGPGSES